MIKLQATTFSAESLNGRNHFRKLGVCGKVMLSRIKGGKDMK
jgi:hypothetical protein